MSDLIARLNSLRKPLHKNITGGSLTPSSSLKRLELANKLTKERLLSSQEDQFVVSFFYNKHFDILEYLVYLRENELTNTTYNVIKKYARKLDTNLIDAITAPRPDDTEIASLAMRIMRGELYRLVGESFDKCTVLHTFQDGSSNQIIDKYAFFGYTTIMSKYLDIFEESFSKCVQHSPEIIDLLDLNDTRVRTAIRTNQQHLILYLFSSPLIISIFNFLDLSALSACDTAECLRASQTYITASEHRTTPNDWFIFSFQNICKSNKESLCKILHISLLIADTSIFTVILEQVSQLISSYLSTLPSFIFPSELIVITANMENICTSQNILMLISNVLRIVNYYNRKYYQSLLDTNSSLRIYTSEKEFSLNDCLQILKTKDLPILSLADLYYQVFFCKCDRVFNITEIFEVPNKFFIAFLDILDSPLSRLILEFHTNLHNERAKDRVARTIFKNADYKLVFVQYLVARHIWYEIDMTDYISYFDDKYRIIYAETNLDWAALNIQILRNIGISAKLYTQLKRSKYSNLLLPVDKPANPIPAISCVPNIRILASLELLPECPKPKKYKHACVETESDNEDTGLNNNYDNLFDPSFTYTDSASKLGRAANLLFKYLTNKIENQLYDSKLCACHELFLNTVSNYDEAISLFNTLFNWLKHTNSSSLFLSFVCTAFDNLLIKFGPSPAPLLPSFHNFLHFYSSYPLFSHFVSSFASILPLSEISSFISSHSLSNSLLVNLSAGLVRRYVVVGSDSFPISFFLSLFSDLSITNFVFVGLECINQLVNSKLVSISYFISILDIPSLLAVPSDEILDLLINLVPFGSYSDHLINLLFKRNILDNLSARMIKLINFDQISSDNLCRIYAIIKTNPSDYIKYGLHKYITNIDECMAINLINLLATTFDTQQFISISGIFTNFDFIFTDGCFNALINNLVTQNYLFNLWALNLLYGHALSTSWFIKLCMLIGNEPNIEIIRKGIKVIKKGINKEIEIIIEKWKRNAKLKRMMRRIYPAKGKMNEEERKIYEGWLEGCDEDELRMLKEEYESE